MSLISGIRGFSVSMYGQSGIVMDWFGLNDPFTQQVPLKITNTYSGTLWFQSQLVNPRSGYYNYSGIQLGNVNSGASTTLVATWDAGVSGWITGSSPITDTLTLNLTTFTSSNYTGSYSSGNFTVFNTLFNRYSGVIKVFGDIYNNDQPQPSLSSNTGGTLSGSYMYAISYIMSGWESDVSAPSSGLTLNSGFGTIAVSWTSIVGATQYFVWRWSGLTDYTIASGFGNQSGTTDLLAVRTVNSYTDTGVAPITTGLYRHRNWERSGGQLAAANSANFLSAPQSRDISANNNFYSHSYMVGKNASGTSLLGPFYGVFHARPGSSSNTLIVNLNTGENISISGTPIADTNVTSNQLSGVWYRFAIMLGSSGSISASGKAIIQIGAPNAASTMYCDDVFVIAVS